MKRIFASLVLIVAVLPAMAPQSLRHKPKCGVFFSTIALAGHSNASGYYCPGDPSPDGVCSCCGMSLNNRATAEEPNDSAVVKTAPSVDGEPARDSEPASGVLLFLVALIVSGAIGA